MTNALTGAALRVLPLLLGVFAAACTIDPPAGTPPAPVSGALEPGPREATFGRTSAEVINNPQLRDKIRALFGADWDPAAAGGGKIVKGVGAYFGRTEPPRGVRIGNANYVAVTGCVPATCGSERVVLLIQESGQDLLARLDEGGFSHYYAHGAAWGVAGSTTAAVDSALRALEQRGRDPYPRG